MLKFFMLRGFLSSPLCIWWVLSIFVLCITGLILLGMSARIWKSLLPVVGIDENGAKRSDEETKLFERSNARVRKISLILLLFLIASCWLAIGLMPLVFRFEPGPNEFGDTFGFANTLFSGFAFAGVVIAIILQSIELRLQREELQGQKLEMEKQRLQMATAVYLDATRTLIDLNITADEKLLLLDEVKYVKLSLGKQFENLNDANIMSSRQRLVRLADDIQANCIHIYNDLSKIKDHLSKDFSNNLVVVSAYGSSFKSLKEKCLDIRDFAEMINRSCGPKSNDVTNIIRENAMGILSQANAFDHNTPSTSYAEARSLVNKIQQCHPVILLLINDVFPIPPIRAIK